MLGKAPDQSQLYDTQKVLYWEYKILQWTKSFHQLKYFVPYWRQHLLQEMELICYIAHHI